MATDPTSPSKGRGKGNRRTGRTRGTPGRRGTLPWRDDPLIRRRLELIEEMGYQPRSVILATVNTWLEREGEAPISEATLKLDIQRAADLQFERITKGGVARMVGLERLKANAWRDVNRLKEGDPARVGFYATIFRAEVGQAHLDGSWRNAGAQTPEAPEVGIVGPSPLELLESGRITPDQYRMHLTVFHLSTGGIDSDVTGRHAGSGSGGGEVIEGSARAVDQPRLPARSNGHGNGARPPLTVTEDGELVAEPTEEPRVVEWEPGDDEAFP